MPHRIDYLVLAVVLGAASVQPADGQSSLVKLPANTWVEIKYATVQPADPAEKGRYAAQGWNKLVYDPDGKRVLFYDRWIDKKHGGYTIYGNCLFGFDPAAAKLTPIKIDHWTKMEPKQGGYRTLALPENDDEPTPCPKHVYHAFEYVPQLKAVFTCNGANQTALRKDGKLVGHDLCDGMWRLDLTTKRWNEIGKDGCPPNRLDDSMAYCPDIHALIYAGFNHQLWIFDLAKNQWRKVKQNLPTRTSMGQTVFYDPTHKRMLILGGGQLDAWTRGKAEAFRELWAFDPKTETVARLADAPTALYSSHLAYDSKRQLFVAIADYNKREQPSGMFCYDPKKNAWHEIKPANPIPPHTSWFGWMQLCYDAHDDCFIGKIREKFYAFRYEPAK
jgi:hypothetical protein